MMKYTWVQIAIAVVVVLIGVLLAFQVVDWMSPSNADATTQKKAYCHANSGESGYNYKFNKAWVQHFRNNGSPRAGHELDFLTEKGNTKCKKPKPTPTPEPTITPEPTPTPEPTKRWCFACERELVRTDENGHKYCARAIPQSEKPKEGFAWETGMDKYCEVEEEPEPTPTPEPVYPVSRVDTTSPPVCTDGNTHSVVANLHVVRNGSEASVNYFITEGDSSNIYWRLNSSGDWQHAVSNVTGNSDNYVSYPIGDLEPTGDYTFGVQQVNGCGGGNTTAVVVDDYLPQTFRVNYYLW